MSAFQRPPLLQFFVLVFALSLPFWGIGALTALQLLPALPVSALGFLCPAAAAAILAYRKNGPVGVSELLRRSFDLGRIRSKIWLVPVVLFMPGVMVLSFVVMRLMRVPLPIPEFSPLRVLALFAAFFVAALGEELGWSGYAIDPLQRRFGALGASLCLGVIWAVVHFVPLLEAHRSVEFIAWWSLGTMGYRVIMGWLYNSTGKSVFGAAVFHAMINLTWQLFPINGSYYDPRVTGLISAIVAIIVVTVWRPQTLARSMEAR